VLNEMIRSKLLQQIYEAIDTLPARCKRVVKLCYAEGLRNAQIIHEARISVNDVALNDDGIKLCTRYI
jgi:DNA-directed RNA polymerase specialized sigma subunit